MMNENKTGGGAVSRWVLAVATVLAMVLTGGSAQGADGTWTNLAGGTWGTAGNWAGGTIADGAGYTADFSTLDITAARTVTLDTSRAIGRLLFGDTGRISNAFDWTLSSSILTLDNAGGTGGNPPTITVNNRTTTINSLLAGSNGLNITLPWSNFAAANGDLMFGGNNVTKTAGALGLTATNSLGGALNVNGGTVRLSGTAGAFTNATALTVGGNGVFVNGDTTAANNNDKTDRLKNTATLTLGGTSGAGTFTVAFPAATKTASQTLASLTVNAGGNVINAVNTAAGVNNLIFTGTAGGAGFVRNVNGLLNVVTNTAAGFNPQFANAPTVAGNSSVSGSGGNEILIGAILNGSDFIKAVSGNLGAATYTTTTAAGNTAANYAGQNVDVTSSPILDGAVTINSLRFNNAAANYTVTMQGANTVTSGGILTGSALNANQRTVTGGTLTSGQGDLWIYGNGVYANLWNGNTYALTIVSKITGNISLTVGGGQMVQLTGANDYTGNTYLGGGYIALGADSALGVSNGTVTAVSGFNALYPTTTFSYSSLRNFVINSGASLSLGNGSGRTVTVGGQISGAGQFASGPGTGSGLVILTGNNNAFTGQYIVGNNLRADEGVGLSSNANLQFADHGQNGPGQGVLETTGTFTRALGSGAGQVQWGYTPALGNQGGGGFAAVGGALTVNLGGAGATIVAGNTASGGSGYFSLPYESYYHMRALNFGSGASTHDVTFQNGINLNGMQIEVVVTAGGSTKAIMSGVISGTGSSGLLKYGDGTLQLAGPNTYAGPTVIEKGTLSVSSLGLVNGSASSLGIPSSTTNGMIIVGYQGNTSTLLYTGTGETSDRTIQVGTKSFNGTVAATSTDTGGATIQNDGTGALVFSAATFNGQDTGVVATVARVLTLQGSNTGTNTIQGIIQNNAVGASNTAAIAVTKAGAGTWILAGANSYSGTTTVTNGTLLVNGPHTGGGAYKVFAGARIGGSGSIGSALAITNKVTLAAGDANGVGTLTVSNVSFTAGSTNLVRIAGASAGQYSCLYTTSGVISLGGNAVLVVDDSAYTGGGQEMVIVKSSGGGSISGQFAGLPDGSKITTPKGVLTLSYSGGDGNDISLRYPVSGTMLMVQ